MSGWSVISGDSLSPGTTIGRYIVLEEIGRGGMGAVYAAYDPHLDRKVALKLLRPRDFSAEAEESRARLLREAQALAKLSHPNVVSVYDAGLWQDDGDGEDAGRLFLAMDFIDGRNLRQWSADESPSLNSRLRHMVAAGRGLAAAHDAGLLHRDFKPENVMIGPGDRVRVVDFGLAKPVADLRPTLPAAERRADAETAGDETTVQGAHEGPPGYSPPTSLSPDALYSPLTRDGSVIGTPAYIAPELLRGETPDGRSDQYSFCVALYELIYGRLPFEAKSPVDLLRRAAEGLYDPPAPTAPCGRVPAWLRSALGRGLQPDPDARFEFLDDLLDILDRGPARRRTMLRAAVTALVVGALAVWAWLRPGSDDRLCAGEVRLAPVWSAERAAAVRAGVPEASPWAASLDSAITVVDRYADRWTSAYRQACEATRVYGEQSETLLDLRMACLAERLHELDSLAAILAEADGPTLEQAPDAAASLSPLADCDDVATLRQTVARPADRSAWKRVGSARDHLAESRTLRQIGNPAAARAAWEEASRQGELVAWPQLRAEVFLEAGHLADETSLFEEAYRHYFESLLAAQRGRHDLAAVQALAGLASVEGSRWTDIEAARRWLAMARAVHGRLSNRPDWGHRLAVLEADTAAAAGEFERAATSYRRELAWWRDTLGPDHPETLQVLHNLASTLESAGRYEEALALSEDLRTRLENQLGSDHPAVARALLFTGNCHYRLGDPERARTQYLEAAKILERTYGREHRDAVMAWNNVAAVLRDLDRPNEALDIQRRVLAAQLELYDGEPHVEIAMTLGNMAQLHLALGDTEAAIESALEAATVADAVVGPEHIERAGPLSTLGLVYVESGRHAEAIEPLEKTLRLVEDQIGRELVGQVRFLLAQAYWESGRDRARALELAERAREDVLAAGDAFAELAAEIDSWLARRR